VTGRKQPMEFDMSGQYATFNHQRMYGLAVEGIILDPLSRIEWPQEDLLTPEALTGENEQVQAVFRYEPATDITISRQLLGRFASFGFIIGLGVDSDGLRDLTDQCIEHMGMQLQPQLRKGIQELFYQNMMIQSQRVYKGAEHTANHMGVDVAPTLSAMWLSRHLQRHQRMSKPDAVHQALSHYGLIPSTKHM